MSRMLDAGRTSALGERPLTRLMPMVLNHNEGHNTSIRVGIPGRGISEASRF
jgi:hypothetical protein